MTIKVYRMYASALVDSLRVEYLEDGTDLGDYFRKQLDADLVEQVRLPLSGDLYYKMAMVVDENGMLKDLPANPTAGLLYAGDSTAIAGDAYLVGLEMTDEGLDWGTLPDSVQAEEIDEIIDTISIRTLFR